MRGVQDNIWAAWWRPFRQARWSEAGTKLGPAFGAALDKPPGCGGRIDIANLEDWVHGGVSSRASRPVPEGQAPVQAYFAFSDVDHPAKIIWRNGPTLRCSGRRVAQRPPTVAPINFQVGLLNPGAAAQRCSQAARQTPNLVLRMIFATAKATSLVGHVLSSAGTRACKLELFRHDVRQHIV